MNVNFSQQLHIIFYIFHRDNLSHRMHYWTESWPWSWNALSWWWLIIRYSWYQGLQLLRKESLMKNWWIKMLSSFWMSFRKPKKIMQMSKSDSFIQFNMLIKNVPLKKWKFDFATFFFVCWTEQRCRNILCWNVCSITII